MVTEHTTTALSHDLYYRMNKSLLFLRGVCNRIQRLSEQSRRNLGIVKARSRPTGICMKACYKSSPNQVIRRAVSQRSGPLRYRASLDIGFDPHGQEARVIAAMGIAMASIPKGRVYENGLAQQRTMNVIRTEQKRFDVRPVSRHAPRVSPSRSHCQNSSKSSAISGPMMRLALFLRSDL